MIAAGIQAGVEAQGIAIGPPASGLENGTPGAATALMGVKDISAGAEIPSRWTSLLASLGFAPQTLAEDAGHGQALSAASPKSDKDIAASRGPESHSFTGARLKTALAAIAPANRQQTRVARLESAQKKENAGKAEAGDPGAPALGSPANAVVNAASAVAAQERAPAEESGLSAQALSVSLIAGNDKVRVELPVERLGSTEIPGGFHPEYTQRRGNESAEVRAGAKMPAAEHVPVSADSHMTQAFRGPDADTGASAKPNAPNMSAAHGTRPPAPAGAKLTPAGAAQPFNQEHGGVEMISAVRPSADFKDTPAQADTRSISARNTQGLISSPTTGAKAARQNPVVDSIRSEHQLSSYSGPVVGTTLVSDSNSLPAALEKPDFSARALPAAGDAFSALDAAHSTPPPTWIHSGAHHAEAGYLDPALGWVGVRAEAAASGVHAALMPGSAEAAQVLATHLSSLNAYLSEQHGPQATVTMGTFDGGQGGQGSAVNSGAHSDAGNSGHEPPAPGGGNVQHPVPSAAMHVASIADVSTLVNGPATAGRYISVMA